MFSGNSNLPRTLEGVDRCDIVYPEMEAIDDYLRLLLGDRPSRILGLGSYSGVDRGKIRIETVCTNKFRNRYIDADVRIEKCIPHFLSDNPHMKESRGIGNSWCNYISWKIVGLIERELKGSGYTFLHVPKGMKEDDVRQWIEERIKKLKC